MEIEYRKGDIFEIDGNLQLFQHRQSDHWYYRRIGLVIDHWRKETGPPRGGIIKPEIAKEIINASGNTFYEAPSTPQRYELSPEERDAWLSLSRKTKNRELGDQIRQMIGEE